MGRIFDSQTHTVKTVCPNCEEKFEHEVELSIYEPSIDIDVQ